MFTVYGSDPSSFSVPSVAFAETGILSNDCWTVIYVEGQPAGFVWITQDLKIMHSDFSTYRDIGTPIYPLMQAIAASGDFSTYLPMLKVVSLTQGPYNFVALPGFFTENGLDSVLLWETRLQKWYRWALPNSEYTGGAVQNIFSYQYPYYTTLPPDVLAGNKFLMYWRIKGVSSEQLQVRAFWPGTVQDIVDTTQGITWNIQTSWQDLGDSTALKAINEIELTSDWAPLTVTLYGATSQGQFDSPTQLKTGPTVTGPISSLGTNKFYCAGSNTTSKFYSIGINGGSLPGSNSPVVLSSFSLESYPMARI
jgi:hypothetical protein